MRAILNDKRIVLGTCYYPEHWPESLWAEDLERMKAVGIEAIRIAEFAWNKIEPREGEFEFDFYDRFLALALEKQMKVIFCTPTATPPAWLTNKYPEVLNADINGNKYYHGARRHYNYNSPKYQELCARIVEKSASHYANHPAIIGWQIDNELNCEINVFYSESDTIAFRAFLKKKYSTLENLNAAWGTEFWNQIYTDWEEIYVPRKTCNNSTNPHEMLDYIRFISDSACNFAKLQSDILRKYIKEDDFVTTNGLFGHLENHRLNKESLDFYTYDSYPNFAYCIEGYDENADDLRDRKWSKHLSEVRSISHIFGIMEQQSGANGWNTRMEASTPKPGQLTLWTMQSIAHGADYVSYFRWRTCTQGTEIYWHGILDYSGRDNERLREVAAVNELVKGMDEIAGAKYKANVAILKDYDNIFDAEIDVWHGRVERRSDKALFNALQKTHTPYDYLYIDDNTEAEALNKYKVIFYPHATIITEKRKSILEKFVNQGGTLIVGCRSGYKSISGLCVMDKLPGLFTNVTGADVFEYTLIPPDEPDVTINWNGKEYKASVFVDRVASVSDTSKVVAKYTSNYFAGDGAIVENSFGAGRSFYFGTAFTEETVEAFLDETGAKNPFAGYIELPSQCEIAVRENENGTFVFVLNYTKEAVEINLKKEFTDVFSKESVSGKLSLGRFGFKVLKVK